MKRTGKITRLGESGVASLNEYADQVFAGCRLISRRPCSPSFWFFQLALDACVWSWGPLLNAALSEQSKQLLTLVDLRDYSKWCLCLDEQLLAGVGVHPARNTVTCWACIFDCHDLCTCYGGCDSSGEIHFPEMILDPRVKRAAA